MTPCCNIYFILQKYKFLIEKLHNDVYFFSFSSMQCWNAETISASVISRLGGFLAGDALAGGALAGDALAFPLDVDRERALTADADLLRERPLAGLAGEPTFLAATFNSLDFLIFDSLTPAVEANFVRASIEP
jgi:hypothetical protein